MATCPKCYGPLSENHVCRPIWVRRLRRQIGYALVGGSLGAILQEATVKPEVPVLGFVLGALLFFGLHEAFNPE
jgi:hypothetical protein